MNKFYSKIITSASILISFAIYSPISRSEDIVTFATTENTSVIHVHNHKKDFGPGHKRHRSGDVSFEKNGKLVGRYSVVSSVVSVDRKLMMDDREVIATTHLPDGDIITSGRIKYPHKKDASHRDAPAGPLEGDIVGGTGNFKGITGTYTSVLTEDKSSLKTTFHINKAN